MLLGKKSEHFGMMVASLFALALALLVPSIFIAFIVVCSVAGSIYYGCKFGGICCTKEGENQNGRS